nr:MAG: putative capsid protein [Arizlama virus]
MYGGYRRFNRRYGARVGTTTRQFPGYLRRPSTTYYGTSFRRRIGSRYGQYSTKRIMNVVQQFSEKKYRDRLITGSSSTWSMTGTIFKISDVPQGYDDESRVGDKLMASSIEMRGVLYANNTLTNIGIWDQFYRLIIFKWYDDTSPTTTDVLETGVVDTFISPFDHDKKSKRKVLFDKTFTVHNNIVWYTQSDTNQHWETFIDLKKKSTRVRRVDFEAGTTAGIGHFYALLVSNIPDANIATNSEGFIIWFRINYTDV